ncbi:MAG: thiamine phosphate synthase [Bacteroidales bacterium]|jgi:thiamine-phosphate pyrophosphorylase|nr:thiamine phosphate synthase [Bacteroidales bacterium]
MWRLIGITPDTTQDVEREVKKIIRFLKEGGFDYFHIRKPSFKAEQLKQYLSLFPQDIRERLTLHDYYELAEEMRIGGININKRHTDYDYNLWNGRLSVSCHSIESLERAGERADYLLLSPVFDSVSKSGYKSTFTLGELQKAKEQSIINDRVIAMGGVKRERLEVIKALGFGGAAMLGSLWKE